MSLSVSKLHAVLRITDIRVKSLTLSMYLKEKSGSREGTRA